MERSTPKPDWAKGLPRPAVFRIFTEPPLSCLPAVVSGVLWQQFTRFTAAMVDQVIPVDESTPRPARPTH